MKPHDTNITFLPLQARTIYAEALERLEQLNIKNRTADLSAFSLNTKCYRGKAYLYAQGRTADGSAKQVYLGILDEHAKQVMETFNKEKSMAAQEHQSIRDLGKLLSGSGISRLDPIEWRVVSALAADGVFRLGGVLVGTIAYRCLIAGMGVKVPSAQAITADVDIAGTTIPVAVTSEMAYPETALGRLEMGFSPMAEMDAELFGARHQASAPDFKVEFLTPLVGRDDGRRIEIRQFNLPAIPLRFLDYLIDGSISSMALGRTPLLVRVPAPERYAVHKLIVSQERRNSPLKAQKDLQQAYDLHRILSILDPDSLEEAYEIARERGPGWSRRVDEGRRAMIRLFGAPLGDAGSHPQDSDDAVFSP